MSAIDRLYSINNKTVKKSINIDDSLYKKLMKFTKKNYDATFSEVMNVCIEEYIILNRKLQKLTVELISNLDIEQTHKFREYQQIELELSSYQNSLAYYIALTKK